MGIQEWITSHALDITLGVQLGMLDVDGVSEALTDPNAEGAEAVAQKVNGIVFAARSVLPDYIANRVVERCAPDTDADASVLRTLAYEIAAEPENLAVFIQYMIENYGPGVQYLIDTYGPDD